MTREEARELLPIIQAFADGKTIEFLNIRNMWEEIEDLLFCKEPKCYRIKPEPKYRPFKDKEECWQEMQNHQPFGWIKDKDGQYLHIFAVRHETDLAFWFRNSTFIDGTPFGIKED